MIFYKPKYIFDEDFTLLEADPVIHGSVVNEQSGSRIWVRILYNSSIALSSSIIRSERVYI